MSQGDEETRRIDWMTLKEKGNKAFKERNFEEAIALYSDAITQKADEAVLYSNRSACHLEIGDNAAAEADALKAIELEASFLRGYMRLHTALCNMGRFDEAAARGKKGLEAAGPSAAAGDVMQLKQKIRQALEAHEALQGFAELRERGNFETAAERLKGPLKNFPRCHHLVFPFAEATAMSDPDAADKALRGVQSSSSIETDLNYLFGMVYYYRGQDGFAKAQTILRETLGWDPEHEKAKSLLKQLRLIESHKEAGNNAFKQKENENAIKEYTAAIDIDPTNLKMAATLRGNRGAAKMAQKDYLGALLDCNFAINNGITTGKMYARRSRIKTELELMEEALGDMQKAADLDRSFAGELRQLQTRCRSAKKKNYYRSLELSRNEADAKTIKKAYMRLCLKWHPDKWSHSTAEEKEIAELQFKEVTEAYEVLSDPQKKYKYDNGLDDNTVNMGGHGSPFGYQSSPFGNSGGRPRGGFGGAQNSPFSFFPGMAQGFSFGGTGGGRHADPRFSAGGFEF